MGAISQNQGPQLPLFTLLVLGGKRGKEKGLAMLKGGGGTQKMLR